MNHKHQQLITEYTRTRLNEEAVSIERVYFYKTDKRVDPKQEEPFWYTTGDIPILISAPHAVRHFRQKKIKMSDEYTGSIAYLLNKLTGCHAIAVTKLYGGDPNVDNPCIYKEKLAYLCKQSKIKLLLDIHGAARDREFDVDFGTNNKKNLLGKVCTDETLARSFQNCGFSKISFDYFAASGPNTIANFAARELGIPAVQIEINKHYRVPAQNPQGFHRLMAALVESIRSVGRG
ncbi:MULTISPECIES: hypothetical protein [Desulfitobacterium]|uniref:N-formylglutamate amidohydrolase n=1 Tax=Desulfitobacterium dehalogenans (strain ATCC 51507 / DSM 9161 / JW/IU-DC1) TaxID=756499 RepID=I4A5E7_DESDJ|nr:MULTISPECIES: hypothetical protein [Desulfitobacterium]AFL99181.1 hypothetical protein Desde_0734 [Desulfitobacterium dehalogenans ATCC 51507]